MKKYRLTIEFEAKSPNDAESFCELVDEAGVLVAEAECNVAEVEVTGPQLVAP